MKFTYRPHPTPHSSPRQPPSSSDRRDRAKFTGQFRTDGTGCPAGSVSVTLSESGQFVNKTATVSLRSYYTQIGPKNPSLEKNKQCRVLLNVLFPLGC